MNVIKNKINSLIIFNIGYIFLLVSDMCKQVDFIRTYNKYISFFGYLFIALYLLINIKKFLKMDKKHLLFIILGSLILLVGFYFSRNFTVIRLLMLILSIMLIDFDEFVAKDILYKGIIIITLVASSLLGFIDNKVVLRTDLTKRYSLGFTHPNVLSLYISFLAFEITYLLLKNRQKITILKRSIVYLIMGSLLLFLSYITDSKSTFLSVFAMFIFIALYLDCYNFLEKVLNNKLLKNILVRSFLVVSLVLFATIVLVYKKPNLLVKFDSIFSNRYSYYISFINRVKFDGLGSVVPDSINSAVLDNMYLKLVLNGGIIFWCTYYLVFTYTSKKTYMKKNYLLLAIIIITTVIGFVETNVLMPTLNIFILYGLSNYFNEHDRKEHKLWMN